MTEDRPKAPPGWYDYDGQQRYWDGERWGRYRPKPEATGPTPDEPPAPKYAAGWYPDPERPGQRYYDGEKWTDHFAPPAQQPVPQTGGRVRDPRNDGLAATGYFLAVLFPIVGVVIGIVLMGRNDPRGGSVIGVAIVVFWSCSPFSSVPGWVPTTRSAALDPLTRVLHLPRQPGRGIGGQAP